MPRFAITLDEVEKEVRYVEARYYRIGRIDEFGRVIPMYELDPNLLPDTYQKYFFDEHDRVVKLEEVENGKLVRVRIYKYDDDSDKVSESLWFDGNGELTGIHRYKYNDKGLMIWRAEYSPYNYMIYYIVSEHSDDNRLTLESWYNRAGKLLQRVRYYYDDRGEVVREDKINADDELEGYHLLDYDENGNLIEKTWYTPDGARGARFRYEYDERQLLTKIYLYDPEDNLTAVHEFVYDERGNKVEERWYDEKGQLIKRLVLR